MDLDELIAAAAFRTQEVRVCFRGDLVNRHAELVAELGDESQKTSGLSGNPEAVRIAGEIVAVEAEQEASSQTFTLSAVGSRKWANLLAKHPPSKEDRRNGADHDPDSFPAAALAACAVDPVVSSAQARAIVEALPAGEWNKLWLAIIQLNVVGVPNPKLAAATELAQANGHSSTTSPPGESPGASSLAGSGALSPPTSTATMEDLPSL